MSKKVTVIKNKVTKQKVKKHALSVDYHDDLIERLKDRKYATVYLNTAFEESLKGDEESQKLFLRALKYVAEAQGNLSSLAKRAHMRRESIYKMLSDDGNPYFYSFASLINAMGFGMKFY